MVGVEKQKWCARGDSEIASTVCVFKVSWDGLREALIKDRNFKICLTPVVH